MKLNIPLYARTPEAEAGQAIRYNKAKEKQEQGAVADLLDHAEEDDIIKLGKSIKMIMNQECVLIVKNDLQTEFR